MSRNNINFFNGGVTKFTELRDVNPHTLTSTAGKIWVTDVTENFLEPVDPSVIVPSIGTGTDNNIAIWGDGTPGNILKDTSVSLEVGNSTLVDRMTGVNSLVLNDKAFPPLPTANTDSFSIRGENSEGGILFASTLASPAGNEDAIIMYSKASSLVPPVTLLTNTATAENRFILNPKRTVYGGDSTMTNKSNITFTVNATMSTEDIPRNNGIFIQANPDIPFNADFGFMQNTLKVIDIVDGNTTKVNIKNVDTIDVSANAGLTLSAVTDLNIRATNSYGSTGDILTRTTSNKCEWVTQPIPQRILLDVGGTIAGGVNVNDRRFSYQGIAMSTTGAVNTIPTPVIYINSSDYPTINGKTPKLKIRYIITSGDASYTGSFTCNLRPITSITGTAVGYGYVTGTALTGSSATITNPSALSVTTDVSSQFDIPATGSYMLIVSNSTNTGPATGHQATVFIEYA